jgi:hypothetical protein
MRLWIPVSTPLGHRAFARLPSRRQRRNNLSHRSGNRGSRLENPVNNNVSDRTVNRLSEEALAGEVPSSGCRQAGHDPQTRRAAPTVAQPRRRTRRPAMLGFRPVGKLSGTGSRGARSASPCTINPACPTSIRRFLIEFGNGGAGPYYGLHPLGAKDGTLGDLEPRAISSARSPNLSRFASLE